MADPLFAQSKMYRLNPAQFDESGTVTAVGAGSAVITATSSYEQACENNVEAGIATITINGIGYFTGTQSHTYVIRLLTVDEKVGQLVNECLASGAETDLDKALWFHDWLIYNANL